MAIPEHAEILAVLPLDWHVDRAEWAVRLAQSFAADELSAPATGWNCEDDFFRMTVTSGDAETGVELCYKPVNGGVLVFMVRIDGGRSTTTELRDRLVNVVERAIGSMGKPPIKIDWWAVLGSRHFPWFDQQFSCGGLVVRPAKLPHILLAKSRNFPSLSSQSSESWCLLRVDGTDEGHDWQTASRAAARRLNVLASVLGVASGRPFEIRQAPWPLSLGTTSPDPDLDVIVQHLNERENIGMDAIYQGEPAPIPDWLDSGWRQLEERPWLAAAALTFSEGLNLATEHPSLAGVAFISTIEAIAYRIFDVTMCSCGQHKDVTARFRATVELVSDPAEAERLHEAYKLRSKVVHQGVLPGMEPARGSNAPLDPYTLDEFEVFQYDQLPRMGRAARALLHKGLTGELPRRRRL